VPLVVEGAVASDALAADREWLLGDQVPLVGLGRFHQKFLERRPQTHLAGNVLVAVALTLVVIGLDRLVRRLDGGVDRRRMSPIDRKRHGRASSAWTGRSYPSTRKMQGCKG